MVDTVAASPSSAPEAVRTWPEGLDSRVLQALLHRLGLVRPLAQIERALASAPEHLRPEAPLAGLLLDALDTLAPGIEVAPTDSAQLRPAHLPALVRHEDRWWILAERRPGSPLKLERPDGTLAEIDEASEAPLPAIWIGLPQAAVPRAERGGAFGLIVSAVSRRRGVLVEAGIASLLLNALAVASSLFAMQVYDRVVPTFAFATLWTLTAGVAVVIAFEFALRIARAYLVDRVGRDVDEELSQHLFDRMLDARLDARPQSVGTLASQMNGFESVRAFFTSSAIFTFADVPFAFAFVGLVWLIGGPIAAVYALAVPIALLAGWRAQRRLADIAERHLRNQHRRNAVLVESIHGAEAIKALGAQWRFSDRWLALVRESADDALDSKTVVSRVTSFTAALSSLAYVGLLAAGVFRIESGDLTVGGLIACSILGGRVLQPLAQCVMLMTQWQTAKEAMRAVTAILALPADHDPQRRYLAPKSLSADLRVQGLKFRYGRSPTAQLDIPRFEVRAGERIALIGPPGSGKSTLLKVLSGLYGYEGTVSIGGLDIGQVSPELLRATIGYLPQDVKLFRGSLRENLMIGPVAEDDARLIDVVSALGLDAAVRDDPRGFELSIGEDGSGLSGGQRQLVGLARLFLAGHRVWLLDEPSSSLDGASETALLKLMAREIGPQDSVIVVTHKSAFLGYAQRLVVMNGGRIIADGERDAVLRQFAAPQAAALPKAA